MPVSVPQGLPAEEQLKKEGLLLSTEKEGRALKVLVLNLMPTKLETSCSWPVCWGARRCR